MFGVICYPAVGKQYTSHLRWEGSGWDQKLERASETLNKTGIRLDPENNGVSLKVLK